MQKKQARPDYGLYVPVGHIACSCLLPVMESALIEEGYKTCPECGRCLTCS